MNQLVSDTHITIITDLNTDRTVVIEKGLVRDATNSLSGRVYDERGSLNTALGVFSIHLIEYCPPWYSKITENAQVPCHQENLIGRFAFWFKNPFEYGIHGRPIGRYQERFDDSGRKQTRGCIALPDGSLEKLMFMILKTPTFKDRPEHLEVQKIKQYNQAKEPTNVAIQISDYINSNPPEIDGVTVGDQKVDLDIKLLVIDTSDPSFSSEPLESLEKKHPFLRLLTKSEEHDDTAPYRIVSNCSATSPIPVFKDSEMSEVVDYTTSLQGVHHHKLQFKKKITGYNEAKGKDEKAIYDKGITSESSQP
ncbi:MAG: L,D-transpeptidase, partial [Proteobacteria bacterium]|nr:L,D-transpeptidase [Pseudomonadota bacterium]